MLPRQQHVSDTHHDLLTFTFHSIHSYNGATELLNDYAT